MRNMIEAEKKLERKNQAKAARNMLGRARAPTPQPIEPTAAAIAVIQEQPVTEEFVAEPVEEPVQADAPVVEETTEVVPEDKVESAESAPEEARAIAEKVVEAGSPFHIACETECFFAMAPEKITPYRSLDRCSGVLSNHKAFQRTARIGGPLRG